jgi:hypothetical protein
VTISRNPTTVNGTSNVEIQMLYGAGIPELLAGLTFFLLGILTYGANLKKFTAIK